jgi:hypothetical protein
MAGSNETLNFYEWLALSEPIENNVDVDTIDRSNTVSDTRTGDGAGSIPTS